MYLLSNIYQHHRWLFFLWLLFKSEIQMRNQNLIALVSTDVKHYQAPILLGRTFLKKKIIDWGTKPRLWLYSGWPYPSNKCFGCYCVSMPEDFSRKSNTQEVQDYAIISVLYLYSWEPNHMDSVYESRSIWTERMDRKISSLFPCFSTKFLDSNDKFNPNSMW